MRNDGRYDVRASAGDEDEIGELIAPFNTMLEEIQKRDQPLLLRTGEPRGSVEARTAELRRPTWSW